MANFLQLQSVSFKQNNGETLFLIYQVLLLQKSQR